MIHNKDAQRLQALAMVARSIEGATQVQIAKEFNTTRHTVERRLRMVKRENLLQDHADHIVKDLVPRAMDVFAQALAEGDVEVAKNVLFGAGILSKNSKSVISPDEPPSVEMTLEVWKERFAESKAPIIDIQPLPLPEGEGEGEEIKHE